MEEPGDFRHGFPLVIVHPQHDLLPLRQLLFPGSPEIPPQALDLLEQAGIATITVKNSTGDALCAYSCEDLRAVYDFFALKEGETLCVQGEQAPVYAYSEDGVRRVLSVDYKAP